LEYFRPDCESPARSHTFRKCRTICNLTIRLKYVKWGQTLFFGAFHTPVDAVQNPEQAMSIADFAGRDEAHLGILPAYVAALI